MNFFLFEKSVLYGVIFHPAFRFFTGADVYVKASPVLPARASASRSESLEKCETQRSGHHQSSDQFTMKNRYCLRKIVANGSRIATTLFLKVHAQHESADYAWTSCCLFARHLTKEAKSRTCFQSGERHGRCKKKKREGENCSLYKHNFIALAKIQFETWTIYCCISMGRLAWFGFLG